MRKGTHVNTVKEESNETDEVTFITTEDRHLCNEKMKSETAEFNVDSDTTNHLIMANMENCIINEP